MGAGGSYDALVVGGGPAGAGAALELAQGGARVGLIERAEIPRYKTCGGGLVGRTLRWLPPSVVPPIERRCSALELHLPEDDLSFRVGEDRTLVAMTMRAAFDQALVETARAAGAEIRNPCSFEGLRSSRAELLVDTSQGELRTRYLIGADGVLGPVATAAGWETPPGCIPALEAELPVDSRTLAAFERRARFDLGVPGDGYAWVFPKRRHLSVGVLTMRRGRASLKRRLADYLRWLEISPSAEPRIHGNRIPIRPRPGGFSRGRVLLAGDAAGFADPVTAEGISYALLSGRLAGRSILADDADPAAVRRGYASRLGEEILPELRLGRLLAGALYGAPRLRRALLRRAGQTFCTAMLLVMSGQRSYRRLLSSPPNYLKLLRRGRAA